MDARTQKLFDWTLRLGDSYLVLGHRLSEWCGHGPILEEDIALTNIALDLVGRSRFLLSHAGELEGAGRDEDQLAYFRDAQEYRNALLCEYANGDFAATMLRQYLFSCFDTCVLEQLSSGPYTALAEMAEKFLKETQYHKRHAYTWLIRLAHGTDESRKRLQDALEELWPFTGDLFDTGGDADFLKKELGLHMEQAKKEWDKEIKAWATECGFELDMKAWMHEGSLRGIHTEQLGYLLAEMQSVPRAYPGCSW